MVRFFTSKVSLHIFHLTVKTLVYVYKLVAVESMHGRLFHVDSIFHCV